jgi:polar amino acid transport system permease protein
LLNKDYYWKAVLVGVLITIIGALAVATDRIDYTWRWNRVPQYFLYNAEDPMDVLGDGYVKEINPGRDGKTEIVYLDEMGDTQRFTVTSDTVTVSVDEELFDGDTVGYLKEWKFGPLAVGLMTTLYISFVAGIFGLVLGIGTGLCRVAKNPALKGLSTIYVEIIRGTPLLVQIFIFYFFFGTVLDIGRMVAGIGALSLFAGAYVAEIVRAGIQSIAKGQMEAARSLGMNVFQSMRYIVLPQALKRTLPPLAGQFISLIKDSSLVSVIAITDLTKAGREVITSTFATFEIWFTVAALYLVITGGLSQIVQWVERRLAISD